MNRKNGKVKYDGKRFSISVVGGGIFLTPKQAIDVAHQIIELIRLKRP